MSDGSAVSANPALERAVLGALLLDRDNVTVAQTSLRPDHFWVAANSVLCDAIYQVHNQGVKADPILVGDWLRTNGLWDAVGANDDDRGSLNADQYLTVLPSYAGAADIGDQIARLVEHKQRRNFQAKTLEIHQAAGRGGDPAQDLDQAISQLVALRDDQRGGRVVSTFGEVADRAMDRMSALMDGSQVSTVIPTGFHDLDRILTGGGIGEGQLVLIGAPPGGSKSSLAQCLATNMSRHTHRVNEEQGRKIFGGTHIESAEMTEEDLWYRMVSSEMRLELTKLIEGNLDDADWGKVMKAATDPALNDQMTLISDPDVTLEGIEAQIQLTKYRTGLVPAVVIVDYIQLVGCLAKSEAKRHELVGHVAQGLHNLSVRYKTRVIAPVQLNRNKANSTDKRPELQDMRESGMLEAAASVVLFIHNESLTNPDADSRVREIIVAKQRRGPTGSAWLAWLAQYTRFANMPRSA